MGAVIDDARQGEGATDIKTYEVIDGQQRITTVYLMLCAAISVLLKINETDEAIDLAEKYVYLRRRGQLHTKVVPSMSDRQDLNFILGNLLIEGLAESRSFKDIQLQLLPKTDTSGQVLKNYEEFKKQLKVIHADHGTGRLLDFISAALTSLHVVEIVVQDPTAGPKIFDSLNSQQAPITTGDLVRNEIFSKVALSDSQMAINLDAELWSPFYMSFNRPGQNERDNFDRFFFPYGLIQNSSLKKNEVFVYLQKEWRKRSPKEILDDLRAFSVPYQDLIFGENNSDFKDSQLRNQVLNFNLMKAPGVSYPFIMKTLQMAKSGELDSSIAGKMLFEVEVFLVRRALCSIEPTGLHAVFKKLWNSLEGELTPEAVRRNLSTEKTVEYPDDEKVLKSFESPLYGKGISRYFFWAWERSLGGDTHSKDDFKSYWVEHVLPNTFEEQGWGSFTKEEHKKLANLAGNLVPLTAAMNGGLGQKPFEQKREAMQEGSKFMSARNLAAENAKWTPKELLSRNLILANWTINHWPFKAE